MNSCVTFFIFLGNKINTIAIRAYLKSYLSKQFRFVIQYQWQFHSQFNGFICFYYQDGEKIDTYCNGDRVNDVVSGNNKMYVRFRSDGSNTGTGFTLYYKEVCEYIITIVLLFNRKYSYSCVASWKP